MSQKQQTSTQQEIGGSKQSFVKRNFKKIVIGAAATLAVIGTIVGIRHFSGKSSDSTEF